MIEFVNLKDGKVFNGDRPYVFWFENGQSVNLNYVRKICFISTSRIVEAHIDSPVFSLLVMGQNIPELNTPDNKAEIINENLYMDLADLKSTFFTSVGYQYNNFFVHMIYVLANSNEAGEIHDSLRLIDNDGEHTYEIAADFYGDNEILKTNLSNFDVHIPESIQKAIYDVNVHEEANDNITLNRKYKELLMNYWDIIANKGSYNSLQNSLAWFEWGDLVRIEEFWKRHHEGMEEYFLTDLNHELDYEFITEFINNTKTTYIGLYMALSRTKLVDGVLQYQTGDMQDGDGNYIYPEDNPSLVATTTKWQLLDLCLKMTLLGNFYSTYFVPIHINVIHSTLEHWVFAYTIKVLHTSKAEFSTTINNIRPFDMVCEPKVKMSDHLCRNYSDTLFLNPSSNGPVFGFEDAIRQETNQLFLITGEFTKYHMGGTYGVVRFRVMEDNPILAGDMKDRICHEVLHWSSADKYGSIESYASIKPTYVHRDGFRESHWAFMLDFNLGFMEPGDYTLTFQFDTLYGNTWTKTMQVTIEDTTRNHIDFYKVSKRKDTDELEFDSNLPIWFKSFQVGTGINEVSSFENKQSISGSTYDEYTPYMEHSLFIEPFMGFDADLNHTVIFDIPSITSVDYYKQQYPHYIWISNTVGNTTRVIGVCREYGLNPRNMIQRGQPGFDSTRMHLNMSYRFHPFMHTIKPIETGDIKTTDMIYMVPQLGHSRDLQIRNWIFTNVTTGETFDSYLTSKRYYEDGHYYGDLGTIEDFGGMQGWFIAPQTPMKLNPGYYNIKLVYNKGNEIQEYNVKSAFLMEK